MVLFTIYFGMTAFAVERPKTGLTRPTTASAAAAKGTATSLWERAKGWWTGWTKVEQPAKVVKCSSNNDCSGDSENSTCCNDAICSGGPCVCSGECSNGACGTKCKPTSR